MFTPGQVIPAGLAMSIVTWENDADNYSTQWLYNVPTEDVNQLLTVLKWFSAVESDLGNCDLSSSVMNERLMTGYHNSELTREFITKYFDLPDAPREDCTDEEYNAFIDAGSDSSMFYALYQLLGYPVDYDYGFARCVDKVDILNIEKEIEIPIIPEPTHTYIGSHQVYDSVQQRWVSNRSTDKWVF